MINMHLLLLFFLLCASSLHLLVNADVCSVTKTGRCEKGFVIYEGESNKAYCLAYNHVVSSNVILYAYEENKDSLCSIWTIIPSGNSIQMMLEEDQPLLISETLQMTSTGEKFEMRDGNSDAVTFDTFKTSPITLFPVGKNCIGAGDAIEGHTDVLKVVVMSFFELDPISMNMVPACPSKLKWKFEIQDDQAVANRKQGPKKESPVENVKEIPHIDDHQVPAREAASVKLPDMHNIPQITINDKQEVPALVDQQELPDNAPCDADPCKHGAKCKNNRDGTTRCNCRATYNFNSLTGYMGENCETACDLVCHKSVGSQKYRKCNIKPKNLDGSQVFCQQKEQGIKCVTECSDGVKCLPVRCRVIAKNKLFEKAQISAEDYKSQGEHSREESESKDNKKNRE